MSILIRLRMHFRALHLLLLSVLCLCVVCPGMARQQDEFAAIDAYASRVSNADASSIPRLGSALSAGARNDKEKARAAFRWITRNIAYDTHAFFSGNFGDMSAENVLKTRKAVCDGYAQLFQALSESMGLEAERIVGNSKGYGYLAGAEATGSANHAWNTVKVNGEWQLVDCTWGAGYVDTDRKFVSRFNDFYFLTPPNQFIYDHFPDDPDKQLLSPPVSKESYEDLVSVRSAFFRFGLGLVTHRESLIRASKRVDIVVNAPDDVSLVTQLLRDGKTPEENQTFVFRRRGEATLAALFPESGTYILRLFAKRPGDSGQYEQALDYRVLVDKPLSEPATFPMLFDEFSAYGLQLKSNAEQPGRVDRNVALDLTSDQDIILIASLASHGIKLKDGYTFVESENGAHKIHAIFPKPDRYVLTVFAKRRTAPGNYNSVLSYTFESTALRDPNACYPVVYEQYYQWDARLFSPLAGRLDASQPQVFKIRVPGADAVAIVNNGKWNALSRSDDVFEGAVTVSPGNTELLAKKPGTNEYVGLLKYESVP